jgi:hypothetical protein
MARGVRGDMTTNKTFTAVIYEGTPGVRVHRDHLRIVGTGRDELVDVVLAQVEQGAGRIFVPVPNAAAVENVVASLKDLELGLVELYGGLGVDAAAAAVRGSGGQIPVGFVGYDG